MARSRGLRTLGPSALIVLLSLIAFITGVATLNLAVNAPKVISLFWVVFNILPHLILLVYSQTGQGTFLTWFNRMCMCVAALASTGAVVSMWFLYPKEVEWRPVVASAVQFIQAEQAGALPADWPVKWRQSSGLQMRNVNVSSPGFLQLDKYALLATLEPFSVRIPDLSGGFYNDGLTGPVKLTKAAALSTSMLAWAMLDAPEAYVDDEGLQGRSLDLLEHGAAYVRACYLQDPTGYGSRMGDVLIAEVGDAETESLLWRRPEDITVRRRGRAWAEVSSRHLLTPSTSQEVQPVKLALALENPSDLASQMSAALSAGAGAAQVRPLGRREGGHHDFGGARPVQRLHAHAGRRRQRVLLLPRRVVLR